MNIADIPTDPSHRWEWIKFQLRVSGTSLAKIARSLEVSGTAVKNAKHLPYPRVEKAIAKALELTPAQLWPERWNADGTPCRRRPNRAETLSINAQKNNPAYDLGHRKTGTDN
ncbi:Winged helix-turn-helix DNA-binding protein [compost metagenome]